MDMNIDMAWSWNHNLQSINRMPTEVRYICPLLRVSCLCLPACLSFFCFCLPPGCLQSSQCQIIDTIVSRAQEEKGSIPSLSL